MWWVERVEEGLARQTRRKKAEEGSGWKGGRRTTGASAPTKDNPILAPCGIAAARRGAAFLWNEQDQGGGTPCRGCAGHSFPKQRSVRKSRHLVGCWGGTSLGTWIKGTLQGLRCHLRGLCLANAGTASPAAPQRQQGGGEPSFPRKRAATPAMR